MSKDPESLRLREDEKRQKNWKRWGPYLSERQWGTIREDYSPYGSCWSYFTHDHARSRVYRWGEDGLLGITDRQCRLCFCLGLWNERDPILKERLFGLTGEEGNNGEDVKECYYYLDSTPTHSYMKGLYKYPQKEFPYSALVTENSRRKRGEREYELVNTGIFEDNRYFDVFVEYAKEGPNNIGIKITIWNRGAAPAPIHVLPQLWFRNSWAWGREGEGYTDKPSMGYTSEGLIYAEHPHLERFFLAWDGEKKSAVPLFTENETNTFRLFGIENPEPYVKDSFHEYVIRKRVSAVNPKRIGTKAAYYLKTIIQPGESETFQLRLFSAREPSSELFGDDFNRLFEIRARESEIFYDQKIPEELDREEKQVSRQAYAGLLWTKQFYYYAVREWLEGDPAQPPPASTRGRNSDWRHLYNRDIISMPDKWEYPWYAAWDLAFHMISFAMIDPDFAKRQLILFLREWYMHPNGQIPAYEFAFSDVNPPVHAWACWRVYKITGPRGKRDYNFLARAFHKLLLNFTWWVNRKDLKGNNLFAGGFLGLDNIGVFDRSAPLPLGGHLEQADGTAWMAFYCATMLAMALELANHDPSYTDVASKFFEHFIAITDAINTFAGTGLWDQLDGFYYDKMHIESMLTPLRVRSLVGIIPLFAVEVIEDRLIEKLPGFRKRMEWFLSHRKDLAAYTSYLEHGHDEGSGLRLLAIPSRERLERVLQHVLDENEFLSQYGVRSLSKIHRVYPYVLKMGKDEYRVNYDPAESQTVYFGGNSNWRGPIWFPINYLLIEALEKYHYFYGNEFKVEFPSGSGNMLTLQEVALELSKRLASLFLPGADGRRPCHGDEELYATKPDWQNLPLFYEYFHGDSGRGIGASHQTGWTALVTRLFDRIAKDRKAEKDEEALMQALLEKNA